MKIAEAQKTIQDLIKMTYSKEAPCAAAVNTLCKYNLSGEFMDILIRDIESILEDAKNVRKELKY